MRQHLEPLIQAEEATRLAHLAVDHAAAPAAARRAAAAHTAAHQALAAASREAIREAGLLRAVGRALAGTGYTVRRIPLEDGLLRLELDGGPDTPVEYLHVPSAALALRALLDDFYATTGLEVRMPEELL
jgi:hypothetical protein